MPALTDQQHAVYFLVYVKGWGWGVWGVGGGVHHHHHHHHQSLNREGRWGTTDDFATSFLHFSLFLTALWDLPNSRPIHSLLLSYLGGGGGVQFMAITTTSVM